MATTTKKTCTIRRGVVIDVRVIAEFPIRHWEWSVWKDGQRQPGTMEDYAKCLEAKCKEFEDFLRDHRSQDIVGLTVERDRADLCSACQSKWEAMDEDGMVACASCGALLTDTDAMIKPGPQVLPTRDK